MQEIIVYRSPLEAAIWHGLTFELIVAMVVFSATLISLLMLSDKLPYKVRRKYGSLFVGAAFIISGYFGIFTYAHMAV